MKRKVVVVHQCDLCGKRLGKRVNAPRIVTVRIRPTIVQGIIDQNEWGGSMNWVGEVCEECASDLQGRALEWLRTRVTDKVTEECKDGQ